MTKPTTPEALAKMISKGFVSADKKFAALAEDIVGIKDDIADLKSTLADHTRDLNIIKNDVRTNLDKTPPARSPRLRNRKAPRPRQKDRRLSSTRATRAAVSSL
jgi:hypothetical protein